MKRTIAVVVAVLLAAGFLATMQNASAATNLIPNPSAENLAIDGSTPVAWTPVTWGDAKATYESSNRPKSGRRSMLTQVSERSTGGASWMFDYVRVKPAKQYVFTDYYQSDVDTLVTLDVVTVNGEHRYYPLPQAGASGNRYGRYVVKFTTTLDTVAISIRHSIDGPGFLRTDRVSLTESRGNPYRTPLPEPYASDGTPMPGPGGLPLPVPGSDPAPGGGDTPASEPTTPNTGDPTDDSAPEGYPLVAGNGAYVSTLGVSSSVLPYKSSASLLWNKPLPANAPLDPNSAGQAAVIARSARTGGGMPNNYPGIFEDMENAPQTFVVDSDQVAFTPVRFDCSGSSSWWNYNAAEFENYINNAYPGKYGVPVPPGVSVSNTSGNSDSPVAIYDYKHDVQFNFWVFKGSNGDYTACWGGHSGGQYVGVKDGARCNAMNQPAAFSQGDGTFCYPFGEDTAGFTDLGTNITLEEARRGQINHAIAISVPHVREDGYSFPATRFNGWCDQMGIAGAIGGAQNCLYVGQRLRLPADFDTSSIANPFTRAVAEAAKTYGFIVHDTAGCICIQSESGMSATSRGMANPWDAIYGAAGNKGAYDAFPWESLQVLAKDYQW
jgi:hypothetical protein